METLAVLYGIGVVACLLMMFLMGRKVYAPILPILKVLVALMWPVWLIAASFLGTMDAVIQLLRERNGR